MVREDRISPTYVIRIRSICPRGFKLFPVRKDQLGKEIVSDYIPEHDGPFSLKQFDSDFLIKIFNKMTPISFIRSRKASKVVDNFVIENEKHIGIILDEPLELSHCLDASSKTRPEDICLNITGRFNFDLISAKIALSGFTFSTFAFVNASPNMTECLSNRAVVQMIAQFLDNKMWRHCTIAAYGLVPKQLAESLHPSQVYIAGERMPPIPDTAKQIDINCNHKTAIELPNLPHVSSIYVNCDRACEFAMPLARQMLVKFEQDSFPCLEHIRFADLLKFELLDLKNENRGSAKARLDLEILTKTQHSLLLENKSKPISSFTTIKLDESTPLFKFVKGKKIIHQMSMDGAIATVRFKAYLRNGLISVALHLESDPKQREPELMKLRKFK